MTQLKVSIADILHAAADKYLSHDSEDWFRERYSCNAIREAAAELSGEPYGWGSCSEVARYAKYAKENPHQHQALKFVKSLGVKLGSSKLFRSVNGDDAQQYRYAWLKTAAIIAEEEGL